MRLVSINVGLPREVEWRGKPVTTAIFKSPVAGPVVLEPLNLAGDRQADPAVHGGVHKAVYAYPAEHYAFWRAELPDAELAWGGFGENFTVEGFQEDRLFVGDRLRVGGAELRVTEPRVPCFKLGLRFGDTQMVKRFLASGRSGFYLAVERPGLVEAGQPFEWIERPAHGLTIAHMARIYAGELDDSATIQRLLDLCDFSEAWRVFLGLKLAKNG